MDMFDLINGLKIKVDGTDKPDGSPQFPAQSCKDIQMCFPQAESGEYWLDPNGGLTDDAIKVHCNFTGKDVETCVEASTVFESYNMDEFKKEDMDHKWVAKTIFEDDKKITYGPRATQWKNLLVTMKYGRQNVTYHCKNSPAHKTMEGKTTNYKGIPFVKFLTKNRRELHTNAESRMDRVNVIEDNCWINDGKWHQTVLEYSTKDVSRLPLRDVAVTGAGNVGEEFRLTIGKACFVSLD